MGGGHFRGGWKRSAVKAINGRNTSAFGRRKKTHTKTLNRTNKPNKQKLQQCKMVNRVRFCKAKAPAGGEGTGGGGEVEGVGFNKASNKTGIREGEKKQKRYRH